ncbi:trihelix transcription factor DF1 [Trifolium repens]|nr:trihelix transcription factor DF1 [Trifolium repens]
MQLGDATIVMDNSTGENIVPSVVAQNGANGGHEEKEREIIDEDDKMNMNGGGGNRWPRQETLALLKIRSDMDGVFRDSSLKGPLWDEVSRKLGELGYHRSSKKCKEKFENVYKYHKRTKEGRSGKSEGKTYRFFDQLQALEKQFTLSSYSPKPQPNNHTPSLPTIKPNETTNPISHVTYTTIPSTNPTALIFPSPPSTNVATNPNNNNHVPYSLPNMNNLFSNTTTSTSSSTASDEDLEEKYRKKRKWKDYFRRLTRQVLAKQEEMQKKFLEAIDKREKEHMAQQDALRIQEINRINKEHELLVQERSSAAQKNAAVIAFLQKLSGQPPLQPPPPPPPTVPEMSPVPVSQVQTHQLVIPNNVNIVEIKNMNNGHKSDCGVASPSRWPKSEVHALIRIRTSLEPKYQENGPKAPLWEDISAGMKKLGYNRNAKRCKEKWENINKYYKKMKESNKQRRDDSKTCPYFNELEALYKEKNKLQNPFGSNSFHSIKSSEMMEPLMVQPEQQWRPPTQDEEANVVKKNINEAKEDEDDGDVDDDDENMDDYEDGDSMEEDEGGVSSRYEVVTTNKLSSMDTVE